jgi:dATP pyrophosphohydrolase
MGRAPFQILVIPFRRNDVGGFEYVIFRRADSGAWQGLAGGGEDDETPAEAAMREAFEEAGITGLIVPLDSTGSVGVEHFPDRDSWDPALRAIPEHAFGMAVETGALSLSPEHREFVWLSVEEALARLQWESNRDALRELHRRLLADEQLLHRPC